MKNKDETIKNLLKDAIENKEDCKMCLTCSYSYFRKGDYDGYCKYDGNNTGTSYMHLKVINTFDVCPHWKEKNTK